MDRRAFFRRGIKKAAETAVKHVDKTANERASHWIRPPYALSELQFLITCTRCTDCIDACPHQVIFQLPARLGAQVVNTPAMDLLNQGCHLCEDWPCVTACEANALQMPEEPSTEWPRMAVAQINPQHCLPYNGPECGACSGSCKVPNALLWRDNKPNIVAELCTGCGMCREVCITNPKAIEINTIAVTQQ